MVFIWRLEFYGY